jgi:selenide,water dikinase
VLSDLPVSEQYRDLLVGNETSDDAAVWQIDDDTCIIGTTDFFSPVVDDPYDFGRIAATNAISDIYAMGGRPIFALAIVGMPIDKLSPETIKTILQGGASICTEAGIPIAGGHSIDCAEPVYGLAVIGVCRPQNIRRNSGAVAGDVLMLTKGLGVGIYSAALKRDALGSELYDEMIASTTLLNRIGADLAQDMHVHAITDITGFGLLGHTLEMASGSNLHAVIRFDSVPMLQQTAALAQVGYVTGASQRNWLSYGEDVSLPPDLAMWKRQVLTDPQTSGGLLIACAAERADDLELAISRSGYPLTRRIGYIKVGQIGVSIV